MQSLLHQYIFMGGITRKDFTRKVFLRGVNAMNEIRLIIIILFYFIIGQI